MINGGNFLPVSDQWEVKDRTESIVRRSQRWFRIYLQKRCRSSFLSFRGTCRCEFGDPRSVMCDAHTLICCHSWSQSRWHGGMVVEVWYVWLEPNAANKQWLIAIEEDERLFSFFGWKTNEMQPLFQVSFYFDFGCVVFLWWEHMPLRF